LNALKSNENTLFIASDVPGAKPASTSEITNGAGAVAFLLGAENVAARLIGSGSVTVNFVDHFRALGSENDYQWEERWVRDEGYAKLIPPAIKAALDNAAIGIDDVQYFAMPSPLRGAAAATAKAIKFGGVVVDDMAGECGYTGAAQAPLMLALALETAKPGERIMVVGFGQGADVLIFEVTDLIEKARPPRGVARSLANGFVTDSYLRMLSFYNGIDLEWGMRAERSGKTALSEQYRSADQIEGFVAGKCGECGTVQFPQLQYCANCGAQREKFSNVSLANAAAKVMTQTADWLTYHPSPPLYVGFVQFENGARVLMEMTDVGPDGLDIGMDLEMVFRIKETDRQRGYNRYFWKAVPKLNGSGA
jgi:uncharacterized OB-fold protein